MKYSWFGADVDMLFQELRQNGAIKITTKGENAGMDKIIESAHAKLLQVMFDPAPVDDLSRAAAEKDSYSSLNQAMKMLKDSGGKKSSLNMSSPGFRQLMASVLDLLITDARAADAPKLPPLPPENEMEDANSEQLQDDPAAAQRDTSTKLTPEERAVLIELFKSAQKFYLEKNYQEAIETFRECDEIYTDLVGKASGAFRYNMAACQMKIHRYEEAADSFMQAADSYGRQTKDGKESLKKAARAQQLALGKNLEKNIVQNKNPDPGEQLTAESASEAYNRARHLDKKAKDAGYPPYAVQEAIDAYEAYQRDHSPSGSRAREVEGRLRSLKRRLAATTSETLGEVPVAPLPPTSVNPTPSESKDKPLATPTEKTATPAVSSAKTSAPAAKKAVKPPAKKKPSTTKQSIADKKPGFSFVASYQMKNIKRSGRMVYQMNHFRSEKQSFTMTENIGSLYRRYGNDRRIFKAVTIDDPVFKQREILVTLDGQDSSTFTKYLNFVTVKMNKRHQSGSDTNDEVVITPETFNKNGNSFSLNYGYKGDTNRNLWLNYKYQIIWSFHGGVEIRSPWNSDNSPMLALYPPYRYRGLTIEGEGEALQHAKVRHAVITVNTRINGKQITTQATIRNQGPAPALHLDIPEGMNGKPGDVSITWYLKGGKKVTSSPQKLEGDIIYWDELPEEGRI
jgi:TolA-binding protein